MYVVYIQELFKFIPKSKVYFSQLEEYSKDQVSNSQNDVFMLMYYSIRKL